MPDYTVEVRSHYLRSFFIQIFHPPGILHMCSKSFISLALNMNSSQFVFSNAGAPYAASVSLILLPSRVLLFHIGVFNVLAVVVT